MSILVPFLEVLYQLVRLYSWVVIIWVIMSWLVQFNVINSRNEVVRMIGNTLSVMVEPFLRRIRRVMPNTGALDLSPVALLLLIYLVERLIIWAIGQLGR